jgi:hypothetical protein
MKATLLVCACALVACDDPKTAATDAAASATASVATTPPTVASATPPPAPKKKDWKCSAATNATAPAIDFGGDTALEKEVRIKLAKPDGVLTASDIAKVKSVNLNKPDYGMVTELNPCVMPLMTGLHDLFVGGGAGMGESDLDDLSPISNLPSMVTVVAIHNKFKNMDQLKKLVHLDRLDLSHTQVASLDVVAAMVDLTELSFDETAVTDLKPLTGLKKLTKVSFESTAVKDITPLKNATGLKLLDITGTPITDYSMLQPALGHGLKVKM